MTELADDEIVEDGFGTATSAICPDCGCRAMYVCRPGDIRCGVCYDNNSLEWYNGIECPKCGYDASAYVAHLLDRTKLRRNHV